jgi:hypothetical protein
MLKRLVVLATAGLVAAVLAVVASAAAPQSTSQPTIEGKFQVGETLTTDNGAWSNSPTSFTYEWQRCNTSGTGCTEITGATTRTYKLVAADVDHTVKVLVTAANVDGKATAGSDASPVISDSSAPRNTARPAITGKAQVGESLEVSNGTWTGGATSFTYQWQRCDENGGDCADVSGATAKTYGVRTADQGKTMRAEVTAHNSAGKTTVNTDRSSQIQPASTSTVVVTETTQGNKAPSITIVSLKLRNARTYLRFRVCDDSFSKVAVVTRTMMPGKLAVTRRFGVTPQPCGVFARSWKIIPRFANAHGRYVVTVRAVDKSQRLSLLRSRSVMK